MNKSENGFYWILGIVTVVMVFIYIYREQLKLLFTATEKSTATGVLSKITNPETGYPVDLAYKIKNIDAYTENEQLVIWVEMFKDCPYWRAFVLDTYNRYKDLKMNKGMTLADRYYYVAGEMMNGMADIEEKYKRCDQAYTRAKGNAEYNSIGLKSM